MYYEKEDVIYQGSFNNTPGGQQIAAKMYDRGVKVILQQLVDWSWSYNRS